MVPTVAAVTSGRASRLMVSLLVLLAADVCWQRHAMGSPAREGAQNPQVTALPCDWGRHASGAAPKETSQRREPRGKRREQLKATRAGREAASIGGVYIGQDVVKRGRARNNKDG